MRIEKAKPVRKREWMKLEKTEEANEEVFGKEWEMKKEDIIMGEMYKIKKKDRNV